MPWHPDWLVPGWQARGVGAVMTTRQGGVSTGPFDSLNLRLGIGDDEAAVRQNLKIVENALGAAPHWLDQVHGTRVVRLSPSADGGEGVPAGPESPERADAALTTRPGVVCCVQVADCLPVLYAAPGARAVAAAHAGWRGLAGGVLEATLAAVCEAGRCEAGEVDVWLGACIGPQRFEVGVDVLDAFGAANGSTVSSCFRPQRPGKWLADLSRLARMRLQSAGAQRISGGQWCTVEDPSRFFSFRRDRITGRMAAAIWIE